MNSTRGWAVLVTVGAGFLLVTLDNSILYTALPTLVRDLNANASESLWIINAYPLVMAGLLLDSGTRGDRIGHTRTFLIGLMIFGATSLLAAFAPNPQVLIAAAFLTAGALATGRLLRHHGPGTSPVMKGAEQHRPPHGPQVRDGTTFASVSPTASSP